MPWSNWLRSWLPADDSQACNCAKANQHHPGPSDSVTSGPDAGAVNIFKNGPDAVSSYTSPFPGQVGARNQIRGDGYFGVDLGLAKRWKMPWNEAQSLQFRWEVFNVTNSVRFDVQTTNTYTDIGNTFGNYTSLITNPRVMQFALRYEF